MNETTQEEGVSPEVTDVDSAAAAIMSRREARNSDPVENESTEEETETVEVEAQEAEADVESESVETESKDADEESEAEAQFQNLEELAEATGMEFSDFLKTIKAKTKVQGEEGEVTLAEAIKSYQLEANHTRNSEAFHAEKKQFEQEQQKARSELQQQMQRTGQAFQIAQQQLTHEYSAIDWQQLEKDEPSEFLLKRQKFGERQAQIDQAINMATQQAQSVMQQQQAQQKAQIEQYTNAQDQMLLQAVPEWSDPTVREKESVKVSEFLSGKGFSPEEISGIRDHRVILMALNAMKGESAVSSADVAVKKVSKAPKLLKPNARQSANQAKATRNGKLVSKAKRTGKVEDVAAALLSRRQ